MSYTHTHRHILKYRRGERRGRRGERRGRRGRREVCVCVCVSLIGVGVCMRVCWGGSDRGSWFTLLSPPSHCVYM